MQKRLPLSTEKKLETLGRWLHEHKALRPVSLCVAGRNAWTEALIIVSASSIRHAQSLADGILAWCREQGLEFLSMEGYQAGQWILVDLNDVVVNIFQVPARELYRLESLWAESPEPASLLEAPA
ncbi:MAG: ribosome silencing factor [Deltaproteobacteria bacterium]|jgi:ribosome-associated protein|nr:ribosome silencing factor [Deltaproteobacteria bacterium]